MDQPPTVAFTPFAESEELSQIGKDLCILDCTLKIFEAFGKINWFHRNSVNASKNCTSILLNLNAAKTNSDLQHREDFGISNRHTLSQQEGTNFAIPFQHLQALFFCDV